MSIFSICFVLQPPVALQLSHYIGALKRYCCLFYIMNVFYLSGRYCLADMATVTWWETSSVVKKVLNQSLWGDTFNSGVREAVIWLFPVAGAFISKWSCVISPLLFKLGELYNKVKNIYNNLIPVFSQSAVKWKCELTDSMRQVDDRLLSSQPTVSSWDRALMWQHVFQTVLIQSCDKYTLQWMLLEYVVFKRLYLKGVRSTVTVPAHINCILKGECKF